MSPSSRGLGHHPFTVSTGVRIPLGTPGNKQKPLCICITVFFWQTERSTASRHRGFEGCRMQATPRPAECRRILLGTPGNKQKPLCICITVFFWQTERSTAPRARGFEGCRMRATPRPAECRRIPLGR